MDEMIVVEPTHGAAEGVETKGECERANRDRTCHRGEQPEPRPFHRPTACDMPSPDIGASIVLLSGLYVIWRESRPHLKEVQPSPSQ